jgi:hypothetical protein
MQVKARLNYTQFCEIRDKLMPCKHINAEPRRKIKNRSGQPYFKMQCPDCGKALSSQLKYADVSTYILRTGKEIKDWDEPLFDRYINTYLSVSSKIKRALGWDPRGFWERYDKYLSSDEWKTQAERIKQRDNYTCQICKCNKAQQVHHLTYERVGNEDDNDLIAVCTPCHQLIHHKHLTN